MKVSVLGFVKKYISLALYAYVVMAFLAMQGVVEWYSYLFRKSIVQEQTQSGVLLSTRCQFHQHFTRAFFIRKCFLCQNVIREKHFHAKNS